MGCDIRNCPKCSVSLDGGEIPADIQEHYSPPYRWGREIGIEVRGLYDGVAYWKCPDCEHIWKAHDWLPAWDRAEEILAELGDSGRVN